MTNQRFGKKTAFLLGLTAILALSQSPAMADIVSTDQLVEQHQADTARSNLSTYLARSDVKAQMEGMGVSSADVQNRVASLTNAEVASLQSQLNTLPAGGGVLGIVLTLLLIFILLDLAGVTDIFPGV